MAHPVRNIDELPSNIQIVDANGKPTQAFVFYLQSLQKTSEAGSTDITALQKELDDTQVGAGLNTGGNYVPTTGSNFIDPATSLYNADLLLDDALGNTPLLVTSFSADDTLSEDTQVALIDASGGNINITLPNPVNMFTNNRSKRIAVTKIDTSSNTVTILPFDTELVVGEANQDLLLDGEILNFITDGTDWYLES